MKTKIILFALFAACGGFCLTSCGGGDDNVSGEVNRPAAPVNSGAYLDGKEIVVLDRNIGATKVGGAGKYLTYPVAFNSCPAGYHLMTYDEYLRLRQIFSTPEEFRDGVLKMPLPGYVSGDGAGTLGRYWLYRNLESSYCLLQLDLGSPSEITIIHVGNTSTAVHQARCVKDYD